MSVDLIAQKLANNKKFLNKYHLELLVFIGSYGTKEYIPRESDMDSNIRQIIYIKEPWRG